jgi:hypothetical protein
MRVWTDHEKWTFRIPRQARWQGTVRCACVVALGAWVVRLARLHDG